MLNLTQKKNISRKNDGKDGKALYKLINNAIYGKKNEKFKNRINVKLTRNKRDYLKWTPKPSYMSHKLFDNDLVAIRKNKVNQRLTNLQILKGVFCN